MLVELKDCFREPLLNVMNFLNEVTLRYPRAISFAPGRPAESLFDVEGSLGEISRFVDYRAAATGSSRDAVLADLGQYNRTNGIIAELIAAQLARDEKIEAPPESIVVTSGCQEAMTILLAALFDPATDVLLSSDPTYIGVTGFAAIVGVPVLPVPAGKRGLEPRAFAEAVAEARGRGLRPRALYDIPDFNNPLGTSMPMTARREILAVAEETGVLVLEDNPYGMFAYDAAPQPTLKSLDEAGMVIYLGTFSKTFYPGLRVGYLVADQPAGTGPDGRPVLLAEELSKVKSLTTVNTPPLLQAVVGGLLLANDLSLAGPVAKKTAFYRTNRDHMLRCLETELGGGSELSGTVRWNRPAGGFFLTVELPFAFDQECLEECAREYGVVCCPMSFFSLAAGREHQIRLSFSYVTPHQIEEGMERLGRFIRDRSRRAAPSAPPARGATYQPAPETP